MDLTPYWPLFVAYDRRVTALRRVGYADHQPRAKEFGAAGEYAYALHHGYPFPPLRPHTVVDGGYDAPDGVNVKSVLITQPRYSLIVYSERPRPPRGFALIVVDPDHYRGALLGRISTEPFYARARTRDFGYGLRLYLDHLELDDVAVLTGGR